jgi:hypothetical protein
MGIIMQQYKPMTFKETGKGYIVLVTSKDRNTKIQILKDREVKKIKPKTKNKQSGQGIFAMLDR